MLKDEERHKKTELSSKRRLHNLNSGNEQDFLLDDLAKSRHTRESGYPICFNSSEFLDSRFAPSLGLLRTSRGNDEGHLCLGDSSVRKGWMMGREKREGMFVLEMSRNSRSRSLSDLG